MTVAAVREMSNDEWVRWQVYFGRRAQRAEMDAAKARAEARARR